MVPTEIKKKEVKEDVNIFKTKNEIQLSPDERNHVRVYCTAILVWTKKRELLSYFL